MQTSLELFSELIGIIKGANLLSPSGCYLRPNQLNIPRPTSGVECNNIGKEIFHSAAMILVKTLGSGYSKCLSIYTPYFQRK